MDELAVFALVANLRRVTGRHLDVPLETRSRGPAHSAGIGGMTAWLSSICTQTYGYNFRAADAVC
jgi:hypothetical protein